MPTLYLRGVPHQLYARLRALAEAQQRDINAQAILLLERAIESEDRHQEQAQILADIKLRRFIPPPNASDCVEMLREDRQR